MTDLLEMQQRRIGSYGESLVYGLRGYSFEPCDDTVVCSHTEHTNSVGMEAWRDETLIWKKDARFMMQRLNHHFYDDAESVLLPQVRRILSGRTMTTDDDIIGALNAMWRIFKERNECPGLLRALAWDYYSLRKTNPEVIGDRGLLLGAARSEGYFGVLSNISSARDLAEWIGSTTEDVLGIMESSSERDAWESLMSRREKDFWVIDTAYSKEGLISGLEVIDKEHSGHTEGITRLALMPDLSMRMRSVLNGSKTIVSRDPLRLDAAFSLQLPGYERIRSRVRFVDYSRFPNSQPDDSVLTMYSRCRIASKISD